MKNTTTIPEIVPLIMATAALCLTLTGCGAGSTEINLSDYIVFSTEGYDTFGTAECWFDDESYTKDVESILAEKDVWNEKKSSQEKMDLALSLYHSYFMPSMDKSSGLSNGDKVEVTTKYNADDFKDIGIKLTGGNESFEVKGLTPLQDFDPFANLQVTFNGISPLCTASLSGTKEGLTYTTSQDAGLALGDEITVSIGYNDGQDFSGFTAKTGLVPVETERTYVVESVPHYPANIAEIPNDMKMKMDKIAWETVKKMETTDWGGAYKLSGIDFLGYYYRTPKRINLHQETDYRFYMVYRIKVLLENGDPYEFFNYWCFQDVSILPDGTCTCNLDNYEICNDKVRIIDATPKATKNGSVDMFFYNYFFRGYKSLDAIFSQQIAKYLDLYDYETTVNDGTPQSVTGNDDVKPDTEEKQDAAVANTDGNTQEAAEKAGP